MNIKDIKIYLVDINNTMCKAWEYYFDKYENVKIINSALEDFLDNNNVRAIVSPANAYGLMDGNYDYAITKYYGEGLMKRIQKVIIEDYYGEQPIGTALTVEINDSQLLIHTPAMQYPSHIKDTRIIYHCMRSTLIEAIDNRVNSIVIPAWGGQCGGVSCMEIASMMQRAYNQLLNTPSEINWDYAKKNSFNPMEF